MIKWLRISTVVIGLFAVLLFGQVVLAQDIRPRHTDPGWQASYWNNLTLSGAPALQRIEPDLNYNWGGGSPDPGISADRFSARWTRYIDVPPGTYRFRATSDDGIRVWIDGVLLIDQWYDHAALTNSAELYLGAGHHLVQVEYYENNGAALIELSWARAEAVISGWRGEYYNNKSLSGAPVLVRDDPEISFAWGGASPGAGLVNPDSFSARWTRNLDLPAGNYRFTMRVDDGARLFVNGHTLIDAWREQAETTYMGDIYLPGGPVTVQMEYYENVGAAVARLRWARADAAPVDTVTVDDRDANFARGGAARSWRLEAEGYNGNLTWTRNNDRARPNYNWGRWNPTLAAGRYEVFVYIPDRFTTTAQARYWISHAGGRTLRVVNQSANGDRWVSLGTYEFQGNADDFLSLADVTFEPRLSRLIAWDAARWEPR